MSTITRLGDISVREVGRRSRFDPARGVEVVITFQGEQAAIESDAATVKANGGTADSYFYADPGIYRMDVVYPDTADEANDVWERVSEFVQEDLRSNPNVIAAAGTSDTLNLWFKDINAAVADGTGLSGVSSQEQLLFDYVSRGQTSHEVRRIVLRRRRTIPIGFTTPRTPTAVESIYTTAALVLNFDIPPAVQAILPADPGSAPSGTTWAWKVRVDSSVLIPYERKTEEVMEWTFAAWSTLTYDLVT
jgi:hypothetical protein